MDAQVTLYYGWRYAFVLARPDQAATWRPVPGGDPNWKSTELPEVMFPGSLMIAPGSSRSSGITTGRASGVRKL
ncbi:MAG: hypothetical protein ACRDNS_15225 [Trebonia sp.]